MKNTTLASSSIFTVHNRTHCFYQHWRSRHKSNLLPRTQLFGKPKPITDRSQNHEYYVDYDGRQFVIRSNLRHQNFDLFTTDVGSQTTQLWKLLQASSDEEYITDFLCLENHLIVMNRIQGLDQVQIYDNNSKGLHQIEFPDATYTVNLEANPNLDSDFVRLVYSSMTSPTKVIDYNLSSRSIQVKKTQIIPSGYSEKTINLNAFWPRRETVSGSQ